MEGLKFFLNKTIEIWPCHNGQVLGNFHILQIKNLNLNGERINLQENKEHAYWEPAWEAVMNSLGQDSAFIDFLRSTSWASFLHVCL